MKKIFLLLIPITLMFLGGCMTEKEAYNKAIEGCDMTGYEVSQGAFLVPFTFRHFYICTQVE